MSGSTAYHKHWPQTPAQNHQQLPFTAQPRHKQMKTSSFDKQYDRFASSSSSSSSSSIKFSLFCIGLVELVEQECIPVGCVPPAHWSYLRISSYPTHAPPPTGATTHAPRGCTWSLGGGVPGPGGAAGLGCVPGRRGVPGPGGCTWSRGV